MGPHERQVVLARLDWERRHVPLGGEVLEKVGPVVRIHTPDGSHYVVIWSELDERSADPVIDREVAWHRELGASFEWKVYEHDRPGDLKRRLAARGFEVGAVESVMVMGTAEARAMADVVEAGPVRVETVRLAQVETFKDLAEQVFGGDWLFTAGQLREAIGAGNLGHRGYVAYFEGEPAGVGRLYVHRDSEFAGLYGGGTAPAYRGRGVYRALVRARVRDAVAWGAKYMMVDARETSRRILERMGFECVGRTWPCVIE